MKRFVILIGALLLLGSAVATFGGADSRSARVTPAATTKPSDLDASAHSGHAAGERTVIVAAKPKLGAEDGTLTVGYERGARPPASETSGVVVTDENCAPDAQGVSHCRNDIRMADGETVRVQHDHRMHDVPCLLPGERVRLRAA